MRTVILYTASFLFATLAVAASTAGFSNYIIGLSDPATSEKFTKAKADVELAGGIVSHEIKLGMRGIVASLPEDQAESFKSKSYVDFIELDQAVQAA